MNPLRRFVQQSWSAPHLARDNDAENGIDPADVVAVQERRTAVQPFEPEIVDANAQLLVEIVVKEPPTAHESAAGPDYFDGVPSVTALSAHCQPACVSTGRSIWSLGMGIPEGKVSLVGRFRSLRSGRGLSSFKRTRG